MPAYLYDMWEQWGISLKSKGVGIRNFPIIPYFSGTELKINIKLQNKSSTNREVRFWGNLVSDEINSIDELTEYNSDIHTILLAPKAKKTQLLQFHNSIPKPGNYSIKLSMGIIMDSVPHALNDGRSAHCVIARFDALPRDATITNWSINILLLVLGAIFGAIAGWLTGGTGN
jgi:hypothetical protein